MEKDDLHADADGKSRWLVAVPAIERPPSIDPNTNPR
jgi:hypothetical protein